MAGQFEIFLDAQANVRFRLVGDDGTVLIISRAFEDIQSAADGVKAVRECAGTGLITQDCTNPRGGTSRARRSPSPVARLKHRHAPAV